MIYVQTNDTTQIAGFTELLKLLEDIIDALLQEIATKKKLTHVQIEQEVGQVIKTIRDKLLLLTQ